MPTDGLEKGGAETIGRCTGDENILALDFGLEVLGNLLACRGLIEVATEEKGRRR